MNDKDNAITIHFCACNKGVFLFGLRETACGVLIPDIDIMGDSPVICTHYLPDVRCQKCLVVLDSALESAKLKQLTEYWWEIDQQFMAQVLKDIERARTGNQVSKEVNT